MMAFDYNYQNSFHFTFLFKFVDPTEDLKNNSPNCTRKHQHEGF